MHAAIGGAAGTDPFGDSLGDDPFADAFESVEISDAFVTAPASSDRSPGAGLIAGGVVPQQVPPYVQAPGSEFGAPSSYPQPQAATPTNSAANSLPPGSLAAEARPQKVSSKVPAKRRGGAAPGRLAPLLGHLFSTLRPVVTVVVQVVLLVFFLTVSVLWARGGVIVDLWEGRALAVILGKSVAGIDADPRLRIEGIAVTRYPTPQLPQLVVVSGLVRNISTEVVPGVHVEARLGSGTGLKAWAGTPPGGLELIAAAHDAAALAWNERLPQGGALVPEQAVPFAVVFPSGVDGARASLRAKVATPPAPPALPKALPGANAPLEPQGERTRKVKKGRERDGGPEVPVTHQVGTGKAPKEKRRRMPSAAAGAKKRRATSSVSSSPDSP
ncbi:MAG: hypothetical protein ACO3JL_18865 [Myxococcota bacterium]